MSGLMVTAAIFFFFATFSSFQLLLSVAHGRKSLYGEEEFIGEDGNRQRSEFGGFLLRLDTTPTPGEMS
ncbi:unnamed protein product [Linum trigynum]|uniref:Uncharacterized protein n=1 Tax=Linum trigynum TaxID=586398 RepID=A0AAV2G6M1_9ROSI